MAKRILIIFSIVLLFLFTAKVFDILVSENWKYTGRNLKKARTLSSGEKITMDFENSVVEVSKDGVYRRITFPLPSIMAHPSGYVVFKSDDNTIVRIQISEEIFMIEDLQKIEW